MSAAVRRSTVEIGSAFERHAMAFCNQRLGMTLRQVGGANDGGVDLRGHWDLPDRRFAVIGQCKAERKALGPRHVRELEGAKSEVSMLLSHSGFSPKSLERATVSAFPLLLVHLPGTEDDELLADVLWWNRAMADALGRDYELKREILSSGPQMRIWHQGKPL